MAQMSLENLTGLTAFARAASLGSYTAAARSLDVSPSAVSKSIQRLERQLGLSLFSRTTRSLTLTAEGRELHEHALRVLREAEEIEQFAVAARAEPAGALKIAVPVPLGVHLIAPALPRFRQRFPSLTIDLRLSDRYVDLVEESIDVAVRVGELADSRLIAKRLAPYRLCAFASPAYLERQGVPARPEDLLQHECINFRYQSSGRLLRWPFQIAGRLLEVPPNAGITVDESDAVTAITVAGGGIGIIATFVAAPYVQAGQLRPVLSQFAFDRSVISALWPESRRGSPNVKAFLALLEEIFVEPAPWDALVSGEAQKP